MLFLIIGAVLSIIGAAGCVWGNHLNEIELDNIEDAAENGIELAQLNPGKLYIIIGIIAIIAGVLIVAIGLIKNFRSKEKKKKSKANINRLALTALLLSLGTALSMVKIWEMPLGGSITLCSMLPITLIAIEYGLSWGLSSAFIYSIIQFGLSFGAVFTWGLSPIAVVGCIAFDYILAFTALGLAGIFRKKGTVGICIGIFIALFVRFVFHILSGTLIFDVWMPEEWSNPLLYSICYNGAYMLPEFIITMTTAVLLFKAPQFNKLVESNLE